MVKQVPLCTRLIGACYMQPGEAGTCIYKVDSTGMQQSETSICINRIDSCSVQHNLQGSHRLEKYLNILDCLEKSLKIKFALKST